ncbi:MAG: Zn-ribbon domain-containing OB-fold protein [Dehalococcoidia bacterium]
MGFDKFGGVSFTSEAKVADFVSYLEQGKVMASSCKKCGRVYFPPRVDCSNCLTSDVKWFEIGSKGKLLTYTRVNYGPAGFEDDAPYVLAVADFEGGVRVFGRLSREINENDIKVGMALKPIVANLPDEKVLYEFAAA